MSSHSGRLCCRDPFPDTPKIRAMIWLGEPDVKICRRSVEVAIGLIPFVFAVVRSSGVFEHKVERLDLRRAARVPVRVNARGNTHAHTHQGESSDWHLWSEHTQQSARWRWYVQYPVIRASVLRPTTQAPWRHLLHHIMQRARRGTRHRCCGGVFIRTTCAGTRRRISKVCGASLSQPSDSAVTLLARSNVVCTASPSRWEE